MAPSEGIVLAINGPWGSGKTSAVNMALEALEDLQRGTDDGRKIEVVCFNPWWFSAQEDLVRAFFHDVAATLEHTGISKRVVEELKAVGRRASGAKDLLLAGLELAPGGAVVKGVAGGALDIAGKAAGGGKSLAAERDALCDALRTQSKRILVVIDDVDRLPPDEARQIFRMVKSVADLPNVDSSPGVRPGHRARRDRFGNGPRWTRLAGKGRPGGIRPATRPGQRPAQPVLGRAGAPRPAGTLHRPGAVGQHTLRCCGSVADVAA